MLKSIIFRRRYLAMGSRCITEEDVWHELVQDVLKREGITPVTSDHYKVLLNVRNYYLEKKRAPTVREICSNTGLSFGEFFALFPDWPHTLFIIDSIVAVVLEIAIWNVEFNLKN